MDPASDGILDNPDVTFPEILKSAYIRQTVHSLEFFHASGLTGEQDASPLPGLMTGELKISGQDLIDKNKWDHCAPEGNCSRRNHYRARPVQRRMDNT
jgi:hypothetical protein